MSALMDELEFVRVYLNNFLVITLGSSEEHLYKFEEVMKQLQSAGIKCNIDKCNLVVLQVEYLEYIIMQEGIKPDPEKPNQLSKLNVLRIKNRRVSS